MYLFVQIKTMKLEKDEYTYHVAWFPNRCLVRKWDNVLAQEGRTSMNTESRNNDLRTLIKVYWINLSMGLLCIGVFEALCRLGILPYSIERKAYLPILLFGSFYMTLGCGRWKQYPFLFTHSRAYKVVVYLFFIFWWLLLLYCCQ